MADLSKILLVSDFDHTLTDHTGHIPQANIDAIGRFMELGGMFTVCTGRSLPASRGLLQAVPTNAPLLFCNGAGCYDISTGTLPFCRPLPQEAEALIGWCLEAFPDLRLEVHCLDKHYVFHIDAYCAALLQRRGTPYACPEDLTQIPRPWVKFSLYSRNGDVPTIDLGSERGQYFCKAARTIAQRGGDTFTVTHSMPGLIEVQIAGTSKGLAARELAEKLERPVLVCVGDSPNDIPMLEEADLAFRPSDGDPRIQDFPCPKAAPSHEGTVADVIRILEQM
ncbi:MAG: HAD family phosphatase [Oscillospiraceae bacterium]|nr:HAD family phosphatase [Oscillospiraceae bacterium]